MVVSRVILFGVVFAQLADATTFTIGVSRFGIGLENNGIATALYHALGLAGPLLMKGTAILAAIAIIVATADRFPRVVIWGGATATSIGLLGFATNSVSMLILS